MSSQAIRTNAQITVIATPALVGKQKSGGICSILMYRSPKGMVCDLLDQISVSVIGRLLVQILGSAE